MSKTGMRRFLTPMDLNDPNTLKKNHFISSMPRQHVYDMQKGRLIYDIDPCGSDIKDRAEIRCHI